VKRRAPVVNRATMAGLVMPAVRLGEGSRSTAPIVGHTRSGWRRTRLAGSGTSRSASTTATVRVGSAQGWLRLVAGERGVKEACQMESTRPDTLQFLAPITP
jgi:hypothetical protein